MLDGKGTEAFGTLLEKAEYSFNHEYATESREREDGRMPISNNLCEANIMSFAAARRAWLFADAPKGSAANGVLYTICK